MSRNGISAYTFLNCLYCGNKVVKNSLALFLKICAVAVEENGIVIDPKLNVAMTRARENLILVGNKSLLSLDPVFKKLLSLKGEIRFAKLKN